MAKSEKKKRVSTQEKSDFATTIGTKRKEKRGKNMKFSGRM